MRLAVDLLHQRCPYGAAWCRVRGSREVLQLLSRRPQDDFIDIDIRRLLDGIDNSPGHGIGINGDFVELIRRLFRVGISDGAGELGGDGTRRDVGAAVSLA